MNDPRVLLAVDAGGTRTRAALVGTDGALLGRGEAGPGNHHDAGLARACAAIEAAVAAAWRTSGRTRDVADAAALGLASASSARDRDRLRPAIEELALAPQSRTLVVHDAEATLAGGLPGRPGIALVMGTGSTAYGRRADGASWRAGGFGSRVDDAGSATWLALAGLRAVVRSVDGRGPPTVLVARACMALGAQDPRDLLARIDGEGLDRAALGGLARLVTTAAEEGDATAAGILDAGADELAQLIEAVHRRVAFAPGVVPVVASGGLAAVPAYVLRLRNALCRRVPGAALERPALGPLPGAALLAGELLEVRWTPERLARLAAADAPE